MGGVRVEGNVPRQGLGLGNGLQVDTDVPVPVAGEARVSEGPVQKSGTA